MRPSSAKNKGRKFEQEIVLLEQKYTGLGDDDITYTSMGAPGRDIKKSSRAYEMLPIIEECKHLAKIAVYKYYEQAKSHVRKKGDEGREPMVFIKQNNSKPLAIVDAEWFIRKILNENFT